MPLFPARLLCLVSIVAMLAAAALTAQTANPFKASPTSVSVSYQEGDAKLPAAQTVAVAGTAGATVTASTTGGPWLTVTPLVFTLPASLKVLANPTSMAVGTYSGTVTISTTGATPQTLTVAVTLTVKAAPSSLTVSSNVVNVSYVRGGVAPSASTIDLNTTGAVLSYSAAAAGGSWLSVSPKSGILFPAFAGALSISVNPAGMGPGVYKGTITITAPQAANKTVTVTVNLTVGPGMPAITAVWPTRVTQGAPATTITLTGINFATNSVIKAGATVLASTVHGPDVATAVLPADVLANPASLPITVSNPGQGGGDSSAATFTVAAATPVVSAVLNAASFLDGPIAPGQMVTIFGAFLGPDALTSFSPPGLGGSIDSALAGTIVYFDTTPAPVIFTSARQVAVLAPYDLAGKTSVAVVVSKDGVQSVPVNKTVAASAPAFFTVAGTGAGQAAAFNIDETSGAVSLNAESTPAAKGGIVVLYATGEGVTTPASGDGRIVSAPSGAPNSTLTVQVGGTNAAVLYAGGVAGLVSGLLQVNVRIPTSITAAKATPVVLTINGIPSPPGVTIAIK